MWTAGAGGVIEKSTWTGRGVPKMSMFVHKGGGGSKNPKKLSTWFVDLPYDFLSKRSIEINDLKNKFHSSQQKMTQFYSLKELE